MTDESKCPVVGHDQAGSEGKYAEKSDAMRAFANSDWWPEQLNLKGLQHDSPLRSIRWARSSTTPRNSRAST